MSPMPIIIHTLRIIKIYLYSNEHLYQAHPFRQELAWYECWLVALLKVISSYTINYSP